MTTNSNIRLHQTISKANDNILSYVSLTLSGPGYFRLILTRGGGGSFENRNLIYPQEGGNDLKILRKIVRM